MAYYAQLNEENVVIGVHTVNNAELIDHTGNEVEAYGAKFLSDLFGTGNYVQTSYNTREGEHQLGGTPLRANYCGKGWHYDPDLDIFHPPRPYPSWTLDAAKGVWNPPVPYPDSTEEDGKRVMWVWDEEGQEWVKVIAGDTE